MKPAIARITQAVSDTASVLLTCLLLAPFFGTKAVQRVYRAITHRDNMPSVVFDGQHYLIVRRIGGAVECGVESAGRVELAGWAADHAANAPAVAIVAVIDNNIAAWSIAMTRRPEIEQGIGNGIIPAGFKMIVSVPRQSHPALVRVFALTQDECAVQLAADLPPGIIAIVERLSFFE